MYGDTGEIRRLAAGFRQRAALIESERQAWAAAVDAVTWHGAAAAAVADQARRRVAALSAAAERHEAAARALDHHAAEVDRLKALITAIEDRVLALVAGARARLDGLAGMARDLLPDPLDEALSRFDPPPSGSREWLTVHLPGLPG